MSTRRTIAKNALANLARGGATGIVALFLPAILVRHMAQLDYSVWVLVLQIAAYSVYLDFGLQTAIGRYVAFANEKQDATLRNGVFSTALVGLSLACLICVVLFLAVGAGASWLFPQIPAQGVRTMRWALLIIGPSIAIGLPASAWSGVFVGLQRNEIPAIVTGGAKIVSAAALVVVVLQGPSIVMMAAVLAAFNLASYLALFGLARRVAPEVKFQGSLVRWSSAKELANYCYSLTIWSFAMMLVTGLDLLLVGRFQVSALVPYAVAASLVTFVAGAQTAIFSAMMPRAAVVHAQQDPLALGRMVLTSTRVGVLLLIFTGIPLLLYADPIMIAWVGRQYAIPAHALLLVLISANMIRLTGLPYSVVLIGAGQQRLVIISPLMEGLTNLIASVSLGVVFGAIGVAYGTLIGSLVGMLAHVFYNIPRTSSVIRLRVRDYVLSGIGIPALTAVPLLLVRISSWNGSIPTTVVFALGFGLSALLGATLILKDRGYLPEDGV